MIAVGEEYLRIVSWNFVASGLVFVISSMFQAMGNTIPSLVTSSLRIVVVALPAFLLSRLPGFKLRWIWYLSVVAVTLQLLMRCCCSGGNIILRLNFEAAPRMATPVFAAVPNKADQECEGGDADDRPPLCLANMRASRGPHAPNECQRPRRQPTRPFKAHAVAHANVDGL